MIANPHDARVTHDRPLPGCAGVVCGRVCGRVCGACVPFEAFAAIALVRRFERLAQPECVARSNRIYLSLCGLARLHLMHTLHVERWHVHIWLHSNRHSTLLCCSLGRTCSVRCKVAAAVPLFRFAIGSIDVRRVPLLEVAVLHVAAVLQAGLQVAERQVNVGQVAERVANLAIV